MRRVSLPPDYYGGIVSMKPFMRQYLCRQGKPLGYVPFNHLCSDPDIQDVLDQIAAVKNRARVFILDGSVDDYSNEFVQEIHRIFDQQGVDFVILSGNTHFLLHEHDRVFYFPHFWLRGQGFLKDLRDQSHSERRYVFSSFNGVARLHRMILAETMKTKPYLDRCCMTFNTASGVDRDVPVWEQTHSWWHAREFATDQDRALLSRCQTFLPQLHPEGGIYQWDDEPNITAAYVDSYVNIITETNVRQTFFTEKTFKPMASGQFFLSANAPGSIALLESWGFDVFRDIVDHSYDEISDPWQKMRAIGDFLDRTIDLDWAALWAETRHRRQKNIEHFFSHAVNDLVVPFEQYLETV
jgi:hypothetical protein